MKGIYGSSSINSIHTLWYVEAQRDLSNQLKTSLLAPLPTYLMTEAFLTEFNSKKMKWFTEFICCRPKGVLSPHDNGQNFANPFSQRVLAFAHGGVINASVAEVLRLQKDFFFPTANTSITIVRGSGKHRVLSVLNDIGQLGRESANNLCSYRHTP